MRRRTVQPVRHSNNGENAQRCAYYLLHSYKMIHLIVCALIYGWMFFSRTNALIREAIFATVIYAIILYRLEKSTGGYKLGRLRISLIVFSKWVSLAIMQLGSFLIEFIHYSVLNIKSHVICLLVLWILSLLWTMGGDKLAWALNPPQKTIIVYDSRNIWDLQRMSRPFPRQLDVIASIEISQGLDVIQAKTLELEADVIYIYRIAPDLRNDLLTFAVKNKLYAYVQPLLGDLILNNTQTSSIFSLPVLRFSNRDTLNSYFIGKRMYDVIVSLFALLISGPFMFLIALLIKLDDGGPVFYKQTRLTRNNKEFTLIKFRSMRVDAEADGIARLSPEGDDRVTRVGKWIRRTRVDELPQFFNVFKGDMSVVGPRPERPEIAKQYEKELPEFPLRLLTKAGITGYAQIYGKYNTSPYDKLQMDLLYILKQSLWEDFKLTVMTVGLILSSDSTEGINPGQITAMQNATKDSSIDN